MNHPASMNHAADDIPADAAPPPHGDSFDMAALTIDTTPASAPGRRRPLPRRLLAGAAVLALAALVWLWHGRATRVDVTRVSMAYPSERYSLLSATGYVVPQLKAAVASKATGRLDWLGVTAGSHVVKGQVLAKLDNRDVRSQLETAEANVQVARAGVVTALADEANARATMRRMNNLRKKGYVAASTLDNAIANSRKAGAALASARAHLAAAQAAADSARVTVDYTEIRAPFDGVVLSTTANIGDIVTPMSSAAESKGAVVTMADMSTLEVEADVSETSLARIRLRQPCEIMLDSIPDERFRGVVKAIVPTVDRAKATVTTKVGFVDRDPRILPDMSARVSFLSRDVDPGQEMPVTAVDPGAIVKRDGKTRVFAIWQHRALRVDVQVGPDLGSLVAIRSVLKAGDRVILKPAASLRNGDRVDVGKKG